MEDKPLTIEITDNKTIANIYTLLQNSLVKKMDDQSGLYGGNLCSVEIYYKDGAVTHIPLGIFVHKGTYYEYYGAIFIQVKNIVYSAQN